MKNTGIKGSKIFKALLLGTIISICVMLFACGVLALLIENKRLNEQMIGYGVLVIILISTISGASFAIAINETKRLMTGLLSGLLYSICLLACTALFFGGQYSGVGVTLLVAVAGGLLPGLLSVNKKEKRILRYGKGSNR